MLVDNENRVMKHHEPKRSDLGSYQTAIDAVNGRLWRIVEWLANLVWRFLADRMAP